MRFGLSVPNFAEPGTLLDLACSAETNGWDGFFLWDHIDGGFESPPPMSDPWSVLAAVAVSTRRVRLGTLVTPLPRRRPWVLARQVATVDHLSNGRAVLGVGLGTPPEAEYAAFGEDPDERRHGELLDEGLEIVAGLWSGEPVTYEGRHFQVDNVQFRPRPIQQPRIPIWVAAALPAMAGVRRASRWDGVVPLQRDDGDYRPMTPDELAVVTAEINSLGREAPFETVVTAAAPDAAARREYEQAGATWLIEGPAPGPDWLEDAHYIAGRTPPLR